VTAASSLDNPSAILAQNCRRSSLRLADGRPGDFIGDRPVSSFIHPAGLPINTSKIEVLQRPVESAQYTSLQFAQYCEEYGVLRSRGKVGSSADNALAESFHASLKRELLGSGGKFADKATARAEVFSWLNWYNLKRRHSSLQYQSPVDFEKQLATVQSTV
jgi:hypothetical protein